MCKQHPASETHARFQIDCTFTVCGFMAGFLLHTGTVEMLYSATIAFKLFVPTFKGICNQIIAMLTGRRLNNLITIGKQFLLLGYT